MRNNPVNDAWDGSIKRDLESDVRTHHIHMVESHFEHWDCLLFRDYLRAHPRVAEPFPYLRQVHRRHRGAETGRLQRALVELDRFDVRELLPGAPSGDDRVEPGAVPLLAPVVVQ